jgi:hypothetical protein
LTSESVRWIVVTLLIPLAGFVWNEVEKRRVERQGELERARAESEIVIRLLPSLTSPDEADAASRWRY